MKQEGLKPDDYFTIPDVSGIWVCVNKEYIADEVSYLITCNRLFDRYQATGGAYYLERDAEITILTEEEKARVIFEQ